MKADYMDQGKATHEELGAAFTEGDDKYGCYFINFFPDGKQIISYHTKQINILLMTIISVGLMILNWPTHPGRTIWGYSQ